MEQANCCVQKRFTTEWPRRLMGMHCGEVWPHLLLTLPTYWSQEDNDSFSKPTLPPCTVSTGGYLLGPNHMAATYSSHRRMQSAQSICNMHRFVHTQCCTQMKVGMRGMVVDVSDWFD